MILKKINNLKFMAFSVEYNVLYDKPYDLQETKITVSSAGRKKKTSFSRYLNIFEFLILFFLHVNSPLSNSKNTCLLYGEITT